MHYKYYKNLKCILINEIIFWQWTQYWIHGWHCDRIIILTETENGNYGN